MKSSTTASRIVAALLVATVGAAPLPAAEQPKLESGKNAGTAPDLGSVPVPAPKAKARAKDSGSKRPSRMDIDANHILLDSTKRLGLFTDEAKLRSPALDIDAAELTIVLKEEAIKSPPPGREGSAANPLQAPVQSQKTAPPLNPFREASLEKPAPPATDNPPKTAITLPNQIEKAWAKGHGSIVTIVRRIGSRVVVAKCGEAHFDYKTGDIYLHINPEVESPGYRLASTKPDTMLVMHADGTCESIGAAKTRFEMEGNSFKTPKPAEPAGNGQSAAPPLRNSK